MSETEQQIASFILTVGLFGIICFVMWIAKAYEKEIKQLKKEAIEKGYAEYGSKSGKWQWK
jgi:hypothetical protein